MPSPDIREWGKQVTPPGRAGTQRARPITPDERARVTIVALTGEQWAHDGDGEDLGGSYSSGRPGQRSPVKVMCTRPLVAPKVVAPVIPPKGRTSVQPGPLCQCVPLTSPGASR